MKEIWKDIKGYEGEYMVSNYGNVLSLLGRKPRILKFRKTKRGYHRVSLHAHNDTLVHRLVAEAFIDNPQNLPEVNHKDECPNNNNVNNLEWCSHKYNVNYGTCQQRARLKQSLTHPQHLREKFNKKVLCVETGVVYISINDASRSTGVSRVTISKVCRGIRKTSGGYHWKFVEETH